MTLNPDSLLEAKAAVITALDRDLQVIHDFGCEADFQAWWSDEGVEDLQLTGAQLSEVFYQLKAEVYTYESCLGEYERLLTGKPDKALRVDDFHYAYLSASGDLICLTINDGETMADAQPNDFYCDAFNSCTGGWMDETYIDTRNHITAAVFVDVPGKY
ncbi:TPA: hypothetical protein ACP32N_005011 [Pseudomonas aeruginosa]